MFAKNKNTDRPKIATKKTVTNTTNANRAKYCFCFVSFVAVLDAHRPTNFGVSFAVDACGGAYEIEIIIRRSLSMCVW